MVRNTTAIYSQGSSNPCGYEIHLIHHTHAQGRDDQSLIAIANSNGVCNLMNETSVLTVSSVSLPMMASLAVRHRRCFLLFVYVCVLEETGSIID